VKADRGASAPTVVAVVGSPRLRGNTVYATRLATDELERRGVRCETVHIAELKIQLCRGHDDCGERDACPFTDDAEGAYDRMWAADGLILASPVHFATVSALMKIFLDRTNHRYLKGPPLQPKVAGLIAVGGQGGMKDTLHTLQRYLEIVCPVEPPVYTAKGRADKLGEAEASSKLRDSVLAMADAMADTLLGG
jgi:multimeric flavodoxin WrbA